MNTFAAGASALGYLYQVHYGLYVMLCNTDEEKDLILEGIDDLEIIESDHTTLAQLKYKTNRKGSLTRRSPDLWKTLRVWCEQIEKGKIDPQKTSFTIITTGHCPKDSIIGSFLLDKKNKLDETIKKLDAIATEKTNNTNLKGYKAWSQQSKEIRTSILYSLEVADEALDFQDIRDKIKNRVRFSTDERNLPAFIDQLLGWWYERCIFQLNQQNPTPITYDELTKKLREIVDTFSRDNLPINFDKILEVDNIAKYEKETYVKQLKLIESNTKVITSAISDYRRAFGQRSSWGRNDLLYPEEENKYDERIFQEWKVRFDLLEDEDQAANLGKTFYQDFCIKNLPNIYIRERVRDTFLFRGSSHMLADKKRIGWHPNFKDHV